MTDATVRKASEKAHALDAVSQDLYKTRKSVKRKWNKALIAAAICFLILFMLGVASYIRINQTVNKQNRALALQNQIAIQSKQHIDCIIKDLSTPPPPGASPNAKKYIDIRSTLSSDCNIKFTQ